MRTTFPLENKGFLDSRTNSTQILPESEPPKMKFPKGINYRKAEVTSGGNKWNYPFSRIAAPAADQRTMKNFWFFLLAR